MEIRDKANTAIQQLLTEGASIGMLLNAIELAAQGRAVIWAEDYESIRDRAAELDYDEPTEEQCEEVVRLMQGDPSIFTAHHELLDEKLEFVMPTPTSRDNE